MTSARDIVAGAYQRLGLLPLGSDLDPDRAAAGLAAYNDMLNAWAADGISTPLSGSALSYSLDDAFPLAPQFVEGAKALLAVELAPQSGIEPQPSLQERAQKSREALLAYHVIAPNAGQDTGLTWMPSLRRYGFR
jgi:hypothetical protein